MAAMMGEIDDVMEIFEVNYLYVYRGYSKKSFDKSTQKCYNKDSYSKPIDYIYSRGFTNLVK